MPVSVCATRTQRLSRPEEYVRHPELELQEVVSCHGNAGNQAWIFRKDRECAEPPSCAVGIWASVPGKVFWDPYRLLPWYYVANVNATVWLPGKLWCFCRQGSGFLERASVAPTGSIVWIEGRGSVIGRDSQILRSAWVQWY